MYASFVVAALLLIALQRHQGSIMSFEEYGRIHHRIPFVLDIKENGAELIYFGIRHTRNPADPQFGEAFRLWKKLKPTLAYNEDITAGPRTTLSESIAMDGERGAISFWAKQDRIPIRSIDLSRAEEFQLLSKGIPPERIKMFYLLRSLQQLLQRPSEGGFHRSAEQIAGSDLRMLAKQGVSGKPRSITEIDAVWQRLGIRGDWRTPDIKWVEPGGKGPLNKVGRASSELRDQHMVEVLRAALRRGERVFALVGASHVVMQEPALR